MQIDAEVFFPISQASFRRMTYLAMSAPMTGKPRTTVASSPTDWDEKRGMVREGNFISMRNERDEELFEVPLASPTV